MTKLRSYLWCFFCSYPVLALLLGWAEWDWGKKAFEEHALLKCLGEGILLWVFLHWALVVPHCKWVWAFEGQGLSRFQSIALSTVFLSLPLIGLSYWVGEVRTILQAQEVTIAIVPAVLLSTLVYDTTRSSWKWSLCLWLLVFFQVFLVTEILGPFHSYFNLLTHDNRYEYLRALVPAFTIAWYFRVHYDPKGRAYLGINTIHHAWKRSRFSKVFQTTDPGESSLQSETKASMRN